MKADATRLRTWSGARRCRRFWSATIVVPSARPNRNNSTTINQNHGDTAIAMPITEMTMHAATSQSPSRPCFMNRPSSAPSVEPPPHAVISIP